MNQSIHAHREYFLQLYSVARNFTDPWHTRIKTYESYFYDPINNPDENSRTDVFDLVMQMSAVFQQARTKFSLSRPGDSVVDRTKAEAGEGFLRHVWDIFDKRRGSKLSTSFITNQLMRSAGILHWAYNPNPVPGLEDVVSTYHNPPVDMWSVNPKNVSFVFGHAPIGEVQYVFHTEKRSIQSIINFLQTSMADTDALQRLQMERPHWFRQDVSFSTLNQPYSELKVYWGWHDINGQFRVFNAIMFDDIMIRPFTLMENYKVLPWAFAPAIDTGAEKLENRWLPVHIAMQVHSKNLEDWQEYLKTIVRKMSDQMFILKRRAGNSNESPYEILADNNYVLELEDGDTLEPPTFQSLSPDVWRQTDVIQQQMEVSGLPRSSWGMSADGSQFGYDRAQDGSRLKFMPPHTSQVMALEQAVRGIMSLVAIHSGGVPVYTLNKKTGQKTERITLAGAELAPALWDVKVELDIRLPGDETRDATLGNMWYAGGNGVLSALTVRERYARVDDPHAEQERIIYEKAMVGDDRIRAAYAIDILERMDALPPMEPQQKFEIEYNVQTMRARGAALGLPPQMIEQLVQTYLEMERQNYRTQLMGQQPTAPQGGGSPNPPVAPQDPRMGGGMALGTAGAALDAGMAPMGSAGDPMADQRMLLNQITGTTGRQQ